MKHITAKACLLALSIFAGACGDEERFRLSGSIEGAPSMNLVVSYHNGEAYKRTITAAREGSFEVFGSAPSGAVIEIRDYDHRLLGRTYAVDGEDIELKLSRRSPNAIEASGSVAASEWADFLRANADSLDAGGRAANAAVAAFVGAHSQSIVSTLLLISEFDASVDPAGADSLMQLIAPSARPSALTEAFNYQLSRMVAENATTRILPFRYLDRRDSLRTLRPGDAQFTLLAVDNNRSGRADSIVPLLRRLRRAHQASQLAIVEFSVDADTIEWKRNTRTDTAVWHQGWGAAGLAARGIDRLGLPSVPFFVVCDSAGTQLLRTRSASKVRDYVTQLLTDR